MQKNEMKAMLKKGEPVLGCMVHGALPALVEILGLAGFHFVMIDAEHNPLTVSECERLVVAAEARRITPIIRPPQNNPKVILRYLDIGAMGIVIPDVGNKQEAEAAVQAVKYAPLGIRGVASTRSVDYGMTISKPEYISHANRETMVIAIIESEEGVDNTREILTTQGVDAAFIGTSDLSMSLGVPGQTNHPKVQEAFNKVLQIGLEVGTPIGAIVRGGETPQQYFAMGLAIAFTSVHSLLKKAAKEFVG